ncbi:hypothetical protein AB6905_04470 [Carnobacterium maltaromaticum]|uniref:hypothetical protein n=1 Tax=Carnobacterium maltaromaticum TaxID=2751 RepID=UPI0039BDFDB7
MPEIIGVINNSTGQLFALLNEYRDNFYDSPEFYSDLIRVEKKHGANSEYEIAMICFDEFETYVSSENYSFIYKREKNGLNQGNGSISNTLALFKNSVESTRAMAKKNLIKQSDYGGYHGGVNNTCKSALSWIERLEKENTDDNN